MGSEKRKHMRFPIHQAIEISFGQEDFFNARGVNVSAGGMLIETETELDPQSRIYLFFPVDLEEATYDVEAEGIVRHISKSGKLYQIGVEFFELTPEQKEMLAAYAERLGA